MQLEGFEGGARRRDIRHPESADPCSARMNSTTRAICSSLRVDSKEGIGPLPLVMVRTRKSSSCAAEFDPAPIAGPTPPLRSSAWQLAQSCW